MRRLFYKWNFFRARMLKIKRCFRSTEQKMILSGLGCLRRCEEMTFRKRGIVAWLEFVECCRKIDQAMLFRKRKLLLRAFVLYRKRVSQRIEYRKSNDVSSVQMKQIEAFISSIDAKKSHEKFEEYLRHIKILASSEKDKLNSICERERRQKVIQKQIDADILLEQREQRRFRLQSDIKQLYDLFQCQWALKERDVVSAHESAIQNWMVSAEFKDICLKKEKEIMRVMALGSRITNEHETALSNISAIAYSILDSNLAGANVCIDEFMHCLSSDTINLDQFETALDSCNTSIDAEHMRGLFHDLCLNSTGTDSFTAEELGLKELNKHRQLSNKVCPDGAVWRFYICPHNQELLFHNAARNEKIYESAVTKKHARKIVKENLRSVDMMKVRRDLFYQKCKAYDIAIRNYRAKQIQFMYRHWRGRRNIKRRWKFGYDVPSPLSVQDCVTISILK